MNNFWWIHLPAFAGRWSRILAGILMDGLYLSAIRILSALAPPLLLLLGVLVGWRHPTFATEEICTASLVVMMGLIVISIWSGAWGAWVWLGYVGGDFLLYRHPAYQSFRGQFFEQLFRVRLPLLIAYALLALALMFIPLISRLLRTRVLRWLKRSSLLATGVQALVQGLFHGALLLMWTQAIPTLIRPLYTWSGMSPAVSATQSLRTRGWAIALCAALLVITRVLVERRCLKQPHVALRYALLHATLKANSIKQKATAPVWVAIVLRTIIITLMLAGVLETWVDALLFALVLALMLSGQAYLTRRFNGWMRLLIHIPLPLRLMSAMLISFLMANRIVLTLSSTPSPSLRPIAISVTLSLLVIFLLIPDLSTRTSDLRMQGQTTLKTNASKHSV